MEAIIITINSPHLLHHLHLSQGEFLVKFSSGKESMTWEVRVYAYFMIVYVVVLKIMILCWLVLILETMFVVFFDYMLYEWWRNMVEHMSFFEDVFHNHLFWWWFMNVNGLVLLKMKDDMFIKEFLRKVTVTIGCNRVTIDCHAYNCNFNIENSSCKWLHPLVNRLYCPKMQFSCLAVSWGSSA